jgi:IclR family acetate operon transcriptional repressor
MKNEKKKMDGDKSALLDLRALRVLTVLERVAAANQPVSMSQLALRVAIPKATLARLLDVLVANDYLSEIPGVRGYIPGPRATQLATQTLGNSTFRRSCRAILGTLVQVLGETCNLSVLDGDHVMYIERIETAEPLRMHIEPGTRLPLHCTAGGKLFLASLSQLDRLDALGRLRLTQMTPRTLTDQRLLSLELDRLGALGIGLDDEEFVRGMVGIAVPVCVDSGKMVAALVCHSATARACLTDLILYKPEMALAAEKLGTLFGAEMRETS